MICLEEVSLKQTLDCIKTMKGYSTYRDHKIGAVTKALSGMVIGYPLGTVVIYSEEKYGDGRTITIETAMTQEAIREQKAKGSLLTTVGTMVGVPRNLIRNLDYLLN